MVFKKRKKRIPKKPKHSVTQIDRAVNKIKRNMVSAEKSFALDQVEQNCPYIVGANTNTLLGLAVGAGFTLHCLSNLSGLSIAGPAWGIREGPKVKFTRFVGAIRMGVTNPVTWAAQTPFGLDVRIMLVRIEQIPQVAQAGTNTLQFQDMMLCLPSVAMTDSHSQALFHPNSRGNFHVLLDKTVHMPVQGNGQMPLKGDLSIDYRVKKPVITTYNDNTNAVSSFNRNHYFIFAWCNASAAAQAAGNVLLSSNITSFYEE